MVVVVCLELYLMQFSVGCAILLETVHHEKNTSLRTRSEYKLFLCIIVNVFLEL